MLDEKGFDLWADEYDAFVRESDEGNIYPFAGYKNVLGGIYRMIMQKPGATVLDLGFGTGVLTTKLYEQGCTIYGQDFSSRMIEIASAKMPDAHLYQGDFAEGLVEPLRCRHYDFIIATYALHHLSDAQKVTLLHTLSDYLEEDGKILVGDISFETRALWNQCREAAGDEWDEEEIYIVAEELKSEFPSLSFTQVSHCGGILMITRE